LGVSRQWEFKNTTTNVLPKKLSKSSYKKIDKKSKTDFLIVFSAVSLHEELKKHHKILSKFIPENTFEKNLQKQVGR
jgi:hypothetical protein